MPSKKDCGPPNSQAHGYLRAQAGKHFDRAVVAAFERLLGPAD